MTHLPAVAHVVEPPQKPGIRYEVIRAIMLEYSLYLLHGLWIGGGLRGCATKTRHQSEVSRAVMYEDSLCLLHGRWVGGGLRGRTTRNGARF